MTVTGGESDPKGLFSPIEHLNPVKGGLGTGDCYYSERISELLSPIVISPLPSYLIFHVKEGVMSTQHSRLGELPGAAKLQPSPW